MAIAISSSSALGRPGVIPTIHQPQSVRASQPAQRQAQASGSGPAPLRAASAAATAQGHLGGKVDTRA